MPIALAPTNQEIKIARILLSSKEVNHLASLGLTKGASVTVLSSSAGAVVVLVKGSRLALDRQTASKIIVA